MSQTFQRHIKNSLSLFTVEFEPCHDSITGCSFIFRGPNDMDHFIQVVNSDQKPFENVGTLFCLCQFELSLSADHFQLMVSINLQCFLKTKDPRFVFHKRQQNDTESCLKGRTFVKIPQDRIRISCLGKFNNYTHTLAVGLIAEVNNPLYDPVPHKLCNSFDQPGFVDLVRYLCDDQSAAASAHILQMDPAADHQTSSAGSIGGNKLVPRIFQHNNTAGWEVRTFDIFHQVFDRDIIITLPFVEQIDNSVTDLPQVMRRNVRCHTDSDPAGTVHQQVRDDSRKYFRLLQRVVKVTGKSDRLFIDILQDLH